MEYVAGRVNLACTIFVPYDCDNRCSFCTSKWMYRKFNPDLPSILEKIQEVSESEVVTDFVLSGGEPLSDLNTLKILIDTIGTDKKVFINTTFPKNNVQECITYINSEDKIRGVNISRQWENIYGPNIAAPDDIKELKKPVHINTMISGGWKWIEKIEEHMKTWLLNEHYLLVLREDYRFLTPETLKIRNRVVDFLASKYVYVGGSGCLVCNGENFVNPETGQYIHYHRGLEKSCVRYEERTYINDIIIRPDGKMFDDWDFKKELLCVKEIK